MPLWRYVTFDVDCVDCLKYQLILIESTHIFLYLRNFKMHILKILFWKRKLQILHFYFISIR